MLREVPTAKYFEGWLGLCPDNRITDRKIYSVRTRDVESRVAEVFQARDSIVDAALQFEAIPIVRPSAQHGYAIEKIRLS